MHILDQDGVLVEASDAFLAMLGYDRKALIGQHVARWDAQFDREVLDAQIGRLFALTAPELFETLHRCKDGHHIAVEINAQPVMIDGRRLLIASSRDITAKKAAEASLSASRRLLQTVVDTVPIRVFWKDRDLRYLGCNPIFAHDAGKASPAEVVGRDDYAMGWRAVADLYRADDRRVIDTGEPRIAFDEPQTTPDGHTIWLRTSKVPLRDAEGAIIGVLGVYEDITDRKQAEAALRRSEEEQRTLIAALPDIVMRFDAGHRHLFVSENVSSVTPFSADHFLGRTHRELGFPEELCAFWEAAIDRVFQSRAPYETQFVLEGDSGRLYFNWRLTPDFDLQGEVRTVLAVARDITPLIEHQHQLEHIAHYDALTGLPNRSLLADRLQQAMVQSLRRGTVLAITYLDLDGFKAVNDHHGHDAGDHLLVVLADRMKRVLRDGDTLARLGGDEFVAVLLDLPDIEACVPMLTRLLDAAAEEVMYKGRALRVSASLGVTFFPQADDIDADQLLRQADQAMYQAKLAGKNRYHIFDMVQDRAVRGHHESLERIQQGLAEREFVLHYQPKVNLRTGQVVGLEALIRWRHPRLGLLAPVHFLPVVEDHPLAVALGDWVLDTVLDQIVAWRRQGLDLPVSVNVGARQLQQPDFMRSLQTRLAERPEMPADRLELEVLETSALEDIAQVSTVIEACLALGIQFALDDFGTGYSSLTYLKRLPARVLKIDQSFVRDMLDDPEDLAILEGVLGLATAFRRLAVAEGVETVAHGEVLLDLGCELAQGYGIARPMPAEAVPDWVATWQPAPSWRDRPRRGRDDLATLFAEVEHRAWVTAVEQQLRNPVEAAMVGLNTCRFGDWLDSAGKDRFAGQPAFETVVILHREIHARADALLALRRQGQSEAALDGLKDLHRQRDALIAQLRRLH
ncbi:MAG: EAL domain-containing protein [Pseudomonadota bacterium]